MNLNLSPEQERIIDDALKSGHFRSAEEVIAEALVALREKKLSPPAGNHRYDDAVREMLNFAEKNRTLLPGSSVKQLIHEGHYL